MAPHALVLPAAYLSSLAAAQRRAVACVLLTLRLLQILSSPFNYLAHALVLPAASFYSLVPAQIPRAHLLFDTLPALALLPILSSISNPLAHALPAASFFSLVPAQIPCAHLFCDALLTLALLPILSSPSNPRAHALVLPAVYLVSVHIFVVARIAIKRSCACASAPGSIFL